MTIKSGIIGWPISHSLSPHIHGFWLEKLKIDGTYEKLPVEPDPVSFGAAIKNFRDKGFSGCNVTLPHKAHAASVTDHKSDLVHRLGVSNTLTFTDRGIEAENTDVAGFVACLDLIMGPTPPRSALVLGAGGAAPAVCEALAIREVTDVVLANRTQEKAETLAKALPHLNTQVIDWNNISDAVADVDCIINTTSLGMKGQGELPISLAKAKASTLVADIIYTPLKTPLLVQADNYGLTNIG